MIFLNNLLIYLIFLFLLALFHLYLTLPRWCLSLRRALNEIIAIIVPSVFYQMLKKILEKLMYKWVYNFLSHNNIIYDLQFGFRQIFSTSRALINLTENIREALDNGYIGCGIFVDLQKAFDTVDHQILFSKLEYYGIWGISNTWFKSYLSNRNQFVSINGYDSELAEINCGVLQGSVLGPSILIIH